MIRIFFCTLLITLSAVLPSTAFSATWETSTMRAPGGGLIRIGMSRQEVVKELGEPLRTRASGSYTTAGGKPGKKSGAWTYRGSDGMYTILFAGERVTKIVVTPDRD